MKLFNIDMHISIIHDIKTLFADMGHTVDSCCMSGHTWVNNEQPSTTDIINQGNWLHIDQAMCDGFHARYKDELSGYDGFIHSYPPAFAALFEKFDKPIYTIACTRYDYPCGSGEQANPERLAWLNDRLMSGYRSGQIKFIANNLFDKKYCETFCGGEWTFIPSICSYLEGVRCDGSAEKMVLWDRNNDGLRDEFTHVKIDRSFSVWNRYDRTDLAHMEGIIHLPYNISIMSAFEHYAMGIPMFVPSPALLKKWKQTGRHVLNEVEFCDNLNGPVPDEWIDLADWYDIGNMPGVMQFNSLDHLSTQLDNYDRESITNIMKSAHKAKKARAIAAWSDVLNQETTP